MANYELVNADQLDSDLTAVGNAIRSKGGTSAKLSFPSGMISAIGAISTGVELNFDVVGGTSQPANQKENTIWINTSTPITDWVFSATQPSAVSGRVWISTGTSSAIEFNALKKNSIQVYPISAKQYVSGAWVDVSAMSYQNGKWVNWIVHLYDNGSKCEDVTGGWSDIKAGTTAIAWNGDNVRITTLQSTTRYCSTYGKNAINVAGFSELYARISNMSVGNTNSYVAIGLRSSPYTGGDSNEGKNNWGAVIMATSGNTNQQLLSVPIPKLDGNHYIQLVDYNADVTVREIYLK